MPIINSNVGNSGAFQKLAIEPTSYSMRVVYSEHKGTSLWLWSFVTSPERVNVYWAAFLVPQIKLPMLVQQISHKIDSEISKTDIFVCVYQKLVRARQIFFSFEYGFIQILWIITETVYIKE